jgi:stage II sporulation protein AA (anti-sigma F factor antagonist)
MKVVISKIVFDKDTLLIKLSGEIDHHSAKAIREEVDKRLYLHCAKNVIIDLSGIEFMDSSGLGLILGRYTKAVELGGKLKLLNPTENVLKILKLAGTEKLIPIEFKDKTADKGDDDTDGGDNEDNNDKEDKKERREAALS